MTRASAIRLAVLACLWGSSFLFIKVSLDGLSPIQIVLVRMCAGALVLLGVLAIRGARLPRTPKVWLHLVVATIVANIVPYFLFGWGEERVDSAVAGALNSSTPLFTFGLALSTGTERSIGARRSFGLAIGFAGALIVIAPWRGFGGSATGAVACLLAAASYAISYVYMRRYLTNRGVPPLVLAAAQLATGAILLLAIAPVVARQPVDLTASVLGSVLALGALGTGVAYVLNYRLIHDEGATTASTVTYLLPAIAVTLGVIVLGEALLWNLFVGTAVILFGVALAENRLPRPRLLHRHRPRRARLAHPRKRWPSDL